MLDALLEIRPTDGRVWVDEEGDAYTYKKHRFVYFGSIDELASPVSASPIRKAPPGYFSWRLFRLSIAS